MKQKLLFGIFLLMTWSLSAQNSAVRSIEVLPVCWAASASVDSSVYAYWLMTSRDEVPRVVSYLNAAGTQVDVSGGGAISSGHCCCNGSTGGNTVSVVDNADGTYYAIVDGDTTLIDTRANTTFVSIPITVGDTVFLSGSNVEEILNAISSEVRQIRSRTGCDLLVVQAANGFNEGDLLAQDSTTGAFYVSSSDSTHNWPVGYVCEKLGADSFYVDTEGWLVGAHSFTPYRDYFNQDTSGVATTPGTIQQFAFRTFSDSLRYFDIPEYAVDGAGGLGGGLDYNVIASNGLNDADGTTDVDVELGGTIGKNTTVSVPSNYLGFAGNNNMLRIYPDRIRVVPNTLNEATRALGAALRKETAPGSDANITYTPYGLPYYAPLTFSSNYSVYYESDKSMKWVYHPAEGNGAFMGSVLNTAGGSIERTLTYGLGGTLTQNTPIYFDSTLYLTFAKDPSVLDTTYQFELKIDPDPTGPTLRYTTRVFDSGASNWKNAYYDFTKDSLLITLNTSVGEVASNPSVIRFSRDNGLKISFLNSLTRYIELNDSGGFTVAAGGSSVQVDNSGNIIYSGVPNYASNAAADGDGSLPSGSVYTVTAEDRSLRIKP